MQGYVLVFRPTTGVGTVVAAGGRAYRFAAESGGEEIHGGDLVQFQLTTDAPETRWENGPGIRHLRILQRGADRLGAVHDALASELFRTVHMKPPIRG